MEKKNNNPIMISAAVILVAIFGFVYYSTRPPAPLRLTGEQIAAIPNPSEKPTGSSTPYVYVPAPTAPRIATPTPEDVSYAAELALLDKGDAADAARIRHLLKSLSEQTGDSQAHIADRTARCTVVLREDGKVVTNLRFLEEASDYFKAGGPKMGFDDLSTALIITLER
jgi:hypothetical protein